MVKTCLEEIWSRMGCGMSEVPAVFRVDMADVEPGLSKEMVGIWNRGLLKMKTTFSRRDFGCRQYTGPGGVSLSSATARSRTGGCNGIDIERACLPW